MQLTTIDPRSTRNLITEDPVWAEIDRCNMPSIRSEEDGWERAYSYGLTQGQVQAAIVSLDRLMVGADDETIRAGLRFVIQILGCRAPAARTEAGYVSLLRDVPAGLLPLALRRVSSMDAFHTLPTPGAIANMVKEEHGELKARRARLHRLLTRMQMCDKFKKGPTSSRPASRSPASSSPP